MKAISRSLFQLLTHSYITLFAIVLTSVVFITILHVTVLGGVADAKGNKVVLMMTLTLSMLFGIYFAGALVALRNHYLWHINRKYKHSLLVSTMLLSSLLCIMLGPYLYQIVSPNILIIFLPGSLMLFCMYVLLGSHLLHKILIPVIPIFLYYLYSSGWSENTVLQLMFVATISLVIYMFNQSVAYKNQSLVNDFMAMSNVREAEVSPKFWIAFNKALGSALDRSILNNRQRLDWMVSLPSTKIGLLAAFNALIVIAMFVFLAPTKPGLYDVFTLMMLAMSMLSICMESRNLIKQVKTVAHIYPGEKHFALKNKILFAVDKITLWNTGVFMTLILGYLYLTNSPIDYILLVSSCLAIIMLSMALLPFFLTLSWINVNFILLITIVGYFITIVITLAILRFILQTEMIMFLSLLFLSVFFGLRMATEHYFSKRPLEKLLG